MLTRSPVPTLHVPFVCCAAIDLDSRIHRLHQSTADSDLAVAMADMYTWLVAEIDASLVAEIDARATYVLQQVDLGVSHEDAAQEQCRTLLSRLQQRNMPLEMINKVLVYLSSKGIFTSEQILALSSNLTNNARKRLDQPSNRSMQTMHSLEHYFTQSDWNRLVGTQGTDATEDVIATRLHRLGLMCADAETLERPNAVTQACLTPSDMHT